MFPVTNLLATEGNFLKYVQDNLVFAIIIAACLLAVIVICIVLIVLNKKKKQDDVADPANGTAVAEDIKENEPIKEEPASEEKVESEPEKKEKTKETVAVAATETVKTEEDETSKAKIAYSGKWAVSKTVVVNEAGEEMDGAYFFQLKASNGEMLITSEEYTSMRGAIQGIETFKSNIAKDNFKISVSKKGKYIVKLLTNQGSLLTQGEKYATRARAMNAIASIKRFAQTAVRVEELQITTVPYEETIEPTEKKYDPYKKGKWVVRKVTTEDEQESSFCFELHASNGQILFTSEEYSTVAGLKNGIKTHKNNIEKGNIKAVITRNGDYILKIFTGNGQLLCLGEHYKTKQLCLNAVESVKRFSQSAELNLDNLPEE